jgi:hypothetical protein
MTAAHKSEAPLAGGAIAKQSTQQDFILAGSESRCKRLATIQAKFALAGFALAIAHPCGGPEHLVATRCGTHMSFADLEAAEHWLETPCTSTADRARSGGLTQIAGRAGAAD